MPTLYIIDGYAQFFRAFHAIRTPLSSPVTKEPTNMTFGFVGMLLKLLRGDSPAMLKAGGPPDYVALALDVSGDRGTFRSRLYPEYKATRPDPPETLGVQVDRCLAMLATLGLPVIGAEGYEADDVIATLVHRLQRERPDLRIRILSKDKDLKQLLDVAPAGEAHVEIYDIHTDDLFDSAKLREETGLEPSQVVDMLAVMGDTVDNVPGVDGVGPKTAAQLIGQYKTLEELVAHSHEIKGKRGEALRAASDQLALSRKLVTLHDDAPVSFDLASASRDRLRLADLLPILRELGFNRYQDEVKALLAKDGSSPIAAPPPTPTTTSAQGSLFAHADEPRPQVGPRASNPAGTGDYRCVTTLAQLRALVEELRAAPVIAVDTETTSVSPTRAVLCGVSVSVKPGTGFYIPVRSPDPTQHLDETTVLGELRPVLEDPDKPKIGHNLKYDTIVLRRHGVHLRGLSRPPAPGVEKAETWDGCDTLIASFLVDSGRPGHSLDALSLALIDRATIPLTDLIGSGRDQRTFDTVPLDRAATYASEDADVTLQLLGVLGPKLRAMGLTDLANRVEMPLVEVLADLEHNGILVDPEELERQRQALAGRIRELSTRIQDAAMESCGRTFDPDSPKQLGAILFNKPTDPDPGLGIKPVKKTKRGYSTDAEVLDRLASDAEVTSPIPSLILQYRQLTKLVNTYLVALKEEIHPQTRRIHASFHQTVAATGRLASSDPNLQNIPIRSDVGREIRRAFIAPPGRVLITADYSQIELRLLGHLSRDPGLCEAFERGEDIHAAVAAQVHNVPIDQVTREQRSGAKMVNFGIVYGITSFGLGRRLGISTSEAEQIITGYKRRFAGITTFLEECVAQARRFGYVQTMLGRRRPIEEIDSSNPSRRALAERVAINSVVQGSAADLIKLAMVDLHGRLGESASHWRQRWAEQGSPVSMGSDPGAPVIAGVKMLLQIHDELVFEAPEHEAPRVRDLVVERMEAAMTLTVPLKADAHIAKTWFEGK